MRIVHNSRGRCATFVLAVVAASLACLMPAAHARAVPPQRRAGIPERIGRTVVAATTTVSWITFIPQARIGAPRFGCDYNRAYQFGGDNHTSFDWRDPRYRTALHAVIDWNEKKVRGFEAVGTTHVYRKSTGKLVAAKTASTKDMSVKLLGMDSRSADIRFVLHASNPFCNGVAKIHGAIDGAMTLKVRKDGYWEIRSGTLRQMPNHLMYIYNGGRMTTMLTEKYLDPGCLVGSATCPLIDLTGRYGTFR